MEKWALHGCWGGDIPWHSEHGDQNEYIWFLWINIEHLLLSYGISDNKIWYIIYGHFIFIDVYIYVIKHKTWMGKIHTNFRILFISWDKEMKSKEWKIKEALDLFVHFISQKKWNDCDKIYICCIREIQVHEHLCLRYSKYNILEISHN